MEKLRANVRAEDVDWWLQQFLTACGFELAAE
jgi:hypothetical protein